MIQLMHHFGNDSRFSHSEEARRKQWFIKARQEQRLREDIAEEASENATITAIGVSVIMASEIQIAEFEAKLDIYNEATTTALMENQIEFEALQKRLVEIESRLEGVWQHANIMEDGRRVFLNADRTQAYDEFGKTVSNEEYSYDQFPLDHKPVDGFLDQLKERGEVHDAMKNNRQERDKIHKFDDLKNQHREELAQGGITEDRLDEMDAELLDEMPPSVSAHLPEGMRTDMNAVNLKTEFTTPVNAALSTKTGATMIATPALD